MSVKNNNGTGNANLGNRSVAIGQGCVSFGDDQTVIGRYPEIPSGDTSSDAVIIGGGSSKEDRFTALRVNKDGEVLIGGGEPVYMLHPDTLDIVPVYMTGSNRRIKKVLMSR